MIDGFFRKVWRGMAMCCVLSIFVCFGTQNAHASETWFPGNTSQQNTSRKVNKSNSNDNLLAAVGKLNELISYKSRNAKGNAGDRLSSSEISRLRNERSQIVNEIIGLLEKSKSGMSANDCAAVDRIVDKIRKKKLRIVNVDNRRGETTADGENTIKQIKDEVYKLIR